MKLSGCLYVGLKNLLFYRKNGRFIDSLRLYVRGGAGGMGFPRFGGIGGNGGNVIFEAKNGITMKQVTQKYNEKVVKASKGSNSSERCILGRSGSNLVVEVPIGVRITDHLDRIIGDLNQSGQKVIVARGGLGGCSDTGYSGMKGESRYIRLDLKLIADIGLIGFPNAGKSTLLKAITNAKPKIASYPFTTIKPNIGCIQYPDLRTIEVADLPGLIENAHKNVGMGHRFLRHCERTKLLVLVVDINGFQLNAKHPFRNCLETIVLLNKEMELYRESLLEKPIVLVINKMDTTGAHDKFEEMKSSLYEMPKTVSQFPEAMRPSKIIAFDDVVPISAKTSVEDVENLKLKFRKYLDLYAEEHNESELMSKLRNNYYEQGIKFT